MFKSIIKTLYLCIFDSSESKDLTRLKGFCNTYFIRLQMLRIHQSHQKQHFQAYKQLGQLGKFGYLQ